MCRSGPRAGEGSQERPAAAGNPARRRLPKAARLGKPALFAQAFDAGPGRSGRYMVLWLRRGEGASLRLGVVASRRTFGRAVDRARAKRMLREAFRLNRWRLGGACDVVLVARRRILDASLGEIERDLLALTSQAGVRQGSAAGRCSAVS